MSDKKEDRGARFNRLDLMSEPTKILYGLSPYRPRAYTYPSPNLKNEFNDSGISDSECDIFERHDKDTKEMDDKELNPTWMQELYKSLEFARSFHPNDHVVQSPRTPTALPSADGQWTPYTPQKSLTEYISQVSPLSSVTSIAQIPPMDFYSMSPMRYIYPSLHTPPLPYSPRYLSPYNPYKDDVVTSMARKHKNAAAHAEARHTWSGSLIGSISTKTPVYSCKVFLGGVPWEMTDHDIKLTFSRFGNPTILRPGKHVKLSRASQNTEKAGYLYLIFDSDKQVKSLINSCTHDFSNGGKYYFALNQSRYRPKDVQIIPWNTNDSSFVKSPSARMDSNRTVFVGALHGMLTAEGLAQILEDLFGGVVYVGIDTDKYKYPIGSGRVTFSSIKSYQKAVQAAFIDVKCPKFTKKIQIDPFLEDSQCSQCQTEKGPIFCRSSCMAYFCRNCWDNTHPNGPGMPPHQPIMRNKSRY